MDKHAYLVIAHNNLKILRMLIDLLDYKDNDIYIHIDKKSNINIKDINVENRKSKIKIYKEIDVKWADFSQIETEMFLLKKASIEVKYKYYHLISGVDLPLKSQKYIHDFFLKNAGKEFIHFSGEKVNQKTKNRVEYKHMFTKYASFKKNWLLQKFDTVIVYVQKVMRKRNKISNIQYGSNWFSITDDLARYVLEKEKWIQENFKHSSFGDELFLQTIVNNSSFKENLYTSKFNGDNHSNMRLIDWKRGTPYTYRIEDYNLLMDSEYLWARKFDEKVDIRIVEKIYSDLMEISE